MKAILRTGYGSPDVLEINEIEKPQLGDDLVLVRVHASSINAQEWRLMRGRPYLARPMMGGLLRPKDTRLGVDLAGTVEAVGKDVTEFKPGDKVFGMRWGAFAEYVTGTEKAFVHKPANVSFEQAAAVPVAALTALQGLRDKGGIRPGHKVLVNGAGGGVGTFAVQVAKYFGAEVTAVTRTGSMELARSLGADHVIDYSKEDFTKSGIIYDLIFDLGGTHPMSAVLRVLQPSGTLVLAGSVAKGLLGPLAMPIKSTLMKPFVKKKMVFFIAERKKEDLLTLKELLETGRIKSVIDRTYPFSQVAEAVGYVEQGQVRGKVVITIP
ncbi:MAG: NAD(P)-dependent alcohol dehydrogenase [Anaerolineales bacterium]